MKRTRWEHFHHQADIGVRGIGSSIEEVFEQAAVGLMAVICNVEKVMPNECIEMQCSGDDPEILLVDWLNAIIYEMAVRKMLFSKFQVRIEGEQLTGTAFGETADPERHQTAVEVKGATYTQLCVKEVDGQWVGQCVVDV